MERSLDLILNGRESNKMPLQDTIYLSLEKMEAKDLDAYISKNFNSSDDIRKKYASKIDPFLEQYSSFIESVEQNTGRKFNGSIVITEMDNNLVLERKKVIYKKDMVLFRQITKNKIFLISLETRDYINYRKSLDDNKNYRRIFSEYFAKELRFYSVSDHKFKRIVGQWRNAIKESKYYYDIVRQVLKEYQNRYKELGLDSLDVIYSKYLQNLEEKKQSEKSFEVQEELEALEGLKQDDHLSKDLLMHLSDYQEPVRYKTHADEEGYPGDLEDYSTDIIREDEEFDSGLEHAKTKTLNNGHHKLFDYES